MSAPRRMTEAEIIRRRASGETLQSIATAAGITRERVRQIAANAVSKLSGRLEVMEKRARRWEDLEHMVTVPGEDNGVAYEYVMFRRKRS